MGIRAALLTRPIFAWAKRALPALSDTEREAIEAGDTWWDADLFTGSPDWNKLLATAPAKLSAEEQAFLDGPVEEFCAMLNDWQISWELRDLPPQAWAYLKEKRFFAMILPKEVGGLGFSAFAHSEVVRKISTRSVSAAVVAMVPNSLGPGELLLHFGTKSQQDYWLPRLARGEEIPCFGLTSPQAGSDAASMIDSGVVCKGMWEGKEVLGIKLNWHKRYITLAPVATVLGLAFKLFDPDGLLGGAKERGITVALVPTNLPGIEIGRRHLPALHVFQNGPTWGRDVFVPIDNIIGGAEQAGKGWKMLMSALAAGRGISLPSLSAAGAAYCAHVSGAYARVRKQFGIPIGEFDAIEERLARMAGTAYLVDAARRMTCAALDAGHQPAVITAIMKSQATERMRVAVNDAMDIHGGKAIMEGPKNYMGSLYRAVPVGITVEGANILTRALIQFGQGSIRSHPFLLTEINALNDPDKKKGLADFDRVFWKHVGHSGANVFRAWARSWFDIGPSPDAGAAVPYFRMLSRYAVAFALTADFALLTLGGSLKRKEMISARFGDLLSELYLASAVLKRWNDEGRQAADFPLVAYCMEKSFADLDRKLDAILANLPNRFAAGFLRLVSPPSHHRGPSDALSRACAQILLEPSPTRDRLTAGLFHGKGDDNIAVLDRAWKATVTAEPLVAKMRTARLHTWQDALAKGFITPPEADVLKMVDDAVAAVIAVDDFAPDELTKHDH
ncbi:MAG: acyl-CoA dehydrogenase [Rhizomicrobium sp.]